jgi:hypothetical protein
MIGMPPEKGGPSFVVSAAFCITVAVVCLLTLELGYRAVSGVGLLRFGDWRTIRLLTGAFSVCDYDSIVGWVAKSGITYRNSNVDANSKTSTMDYGIRKNGVWDDKPRVGGILVVGDSFTNGAGVYDNQTWPAQLEQRIGSPVLNASAGGWSLDQDVLWVEHLKPLLKPKAVILGIEQEVIQNVAYAIWAGAPKPYFTINYGALIVHNQPVTKGGTYEDGRSYLRDALSHSFVAAQLMGALDANYWVSENENRRAPVDIIDVSCALLRRLKTGDDADGMRTGFVLQYGHDTVAKGGKRDNYAELIGTCARAIGIEVIDTFEPLHHLGEVDEAQLKSFYDLENGQFGHMSKWGNAFIATLVAKVLREGADAADHPQL